MKRHLLLVLTVAMGLASCNFGPKKDDVLATQGNKVVYATVRCTVPNADGVSCDKKTCKKDARSDCSIFKDRCEQSDHTYDGDTDSGTCIRGDPVG